MPYDRLLEDVPLDHLGIAVGVEPGAIVTAEGNVENRAGIFRRPVDEHVNSFVRLAGC